jgi:hypothetical protein
MPVHLSTAECAQLLLPHLSWSKRGPQCTIGYHTPFTYILPVLDTGRQWKGVPIAKGAEGKAELHSPGSVKLLARWAEEGSLERAFSASGTPRADPQEFPLSLHHGDGSNTVAKKGGTQEATAATNTTRARK